MHEKTYRQTDILELLGRQTNSTAARDEAIDRVERSADDDWIIAARGAVFSLAGTRETFTTDDVWSLGLVATREPRALGAVMLQLSREGYIEPTSEFRLSTRAICHRRPMRVWHSRIPK